MATQPTDLFPAPIVNSHDWFSCPFHDKWCPSSHSTIRCTGIITEIGSAIHFGSTAALQNLIRRGASPNRPCHMDKLSRAVDFPLGLVTSPMYYDRPDDCFLALLGAGADIRLQAGGEEDLRYLKDKLMVFAFRPMASPGVLKAVLGLGVADTEWARERLVQAATNRYWFFGTGPDGKEIWHVQDEGLYTQRQCIVLRNVAFSEEQKARFWRGDGQRPGQ